MKRNNKGQFIKGTNGNTYEGFGIWYDRKGYPCIWINGKSIKLHVYIWEIHFGEKPKGHELHHKDFNKSNYLLGNLALMSLSDHSKLHAGWKSKDGKWILKPCKDCKKVLPLDNFYPRKGLTPSNHCKSCSSINNKKRLIIDPVFREKKRLYLEKYYKNNKQVILKQQKDKRIKNGKTKSL